MRGCRASAVSGRRPRRGAWHPVARRSLVLLAAVIALAVRPQPAAAGARGGGNEVNPVYIATVQGNLGVSGGWAANPSYRLFAAMGWQVLGVAESPQVVRLEAGPAFFVVTPPVVLAPPTLVAPQSGDQVSGIVRVCAAVPPGAAPTAQVSFFADEVPIGTATTPDPASGLWCADWQTFAYCDQAGIALTAQTTDTTGAESAWSDPVFVRSGNHTFTDVPCDHWAHRFIEAIARAGITAGFGDGTFRPQVTITRDQLAVFVARAADLTLGDLATFGAPPCGRETFRDVFCLWWAYRFIEYAASRGLTAGYPDGTFRPTNEVTRAEMAVFVARVRDLTDGDLGAFTPPPCGSETFPDVPCSHPLYPFVEYIAAKGITLGFADGTFRPQVLVTRGQMAVFITRAAQLPF